MNLVEILCNKCKCQKFKVLKPDTKLPDDHWYFTCSECTRKRNKSYIEKLEQMPVNFEKRYEYASEAIKREYG